MSALGVLASTIVENVARYDADASGDLDASEKAELAAEFGEPEAGVPGEHPNRGQRERMAGSGAALFLAFGPAKGSSCANTRTTRTDAPPELRRVAAPDGVRSPSELRGSARLGRVRAVRIRRIRTPP